MRRTACSQLYRRDHRDILHSSCSGFRGVVQGVSCACLVRRGALSTACPQPVHRLVNIGRAVRQIWMSNIGVMACMKRNAGQRSEAWRDASGHGFPFPRRDCTRGVLSVSRLRKQRAQGMPDAGRTHGPPANKKAGGSYHRFSRNSRHSLRDGVTAYDVLSPGTGLSCPRRPRHSSRRRT